MTHESDRAVDKRGNTQLSLGVDKRQQPYWILNTFSVEIPMSGGRSVDAIGRELRGLMERTVTLHAHTGDRLR